MDGAFLAAVFLAGGLFAAAGSAFFVGAFAAAGAAFFAGAFVAVAAFLAGAFVAVAFFDGAAAAFLAGASLAGASLAGAFLAGAAFLAVEAFFVGPALFADAAFLMENLGFPPIVTEPVPGMIVDSSPVDQVTLMSLPLTAVTTPSRAGWPNFREATCTRSPTDAICTSV